MRRSAVCCAVLLTPVWGVLGGCGAEDPPAHAQNEGVAAESLATQIGRLFEPKDADVDVDVSCTGGIAAETGARQDCEAETEDGRRVGIHVVVESLRDGEPAYAITPYLGPDLVARAVDDSLANDSASTSCQGELTGRKGSSTTCTVSTPDGTTPVTATVTRVSGLRIDFDVSS